MQHQHLEGFSDSNPYFYYYTWKCRICNLIYPQKIVSEKKGNVRITVSVIAVYKQWIY